ncbi:MULTISPECIES: NAD(P)H-dependent oxidoreductase [unclassified Pseudomonas]|jgi:NAD(P)H dehydrogenase (quinone)|uniref:NAD(P)H-dependent oxidoreductase n=1 Tax=unclassified Pseudomonas TaxID=196821 RepID=UPI002A35E970|nr:MULTISPECIES: NAD(P)H-dependent oxidoreductase [unclassified Pseudomonas]MDX9674111.1 NAD(P)H-dependent oxidoreductase [Pseudomonas sp. P8_250]WPN37368.1 NAD(P)H-dependent oxidoreductase [Pseudomonas sp. P8_139]WPN40830.1 NAD(P)H-dependent oxidoreductase [Pseudomonas sp. P8_229]
MHALIVVAHHQPRSLTHSVATQIAEGLTQAEPANTCEIADLYAQGFQPVFGAADFAVHHREALPPADVQAEHARIDRADALVLVFPVYWWSMPALLKGWIDRVFSNGWAFDYGSDQKHIKKLQRLRVHLVGLGGADAGAFQRHGYAEAMKAQIEHGIFDYSGATVQSSTLLLESESSDPQGHLQTAYKIGVRIFPVPGGSEPAREGTRAVELIAS